MLQDAHDSPKTSESFHLLPDPSLHGIEIGVKEQQLILSWQHLQLVTVVLRHEQEETVVWSPDLITSDPYEIDSLSKSLKNAVAGIVKSGITGILRERSGAHRVEPSIFNRIVVEILRSLGTFIPPATVVNFLTPLIQEVIISWPNIVEQRRRKYLIERLLFFASDSATPPEILRELAQAPQLRPAVAGNPNASPDFLNQLSQDPDIGIVSAVAMNPSTPADLLRKLSQDSNLEVIRGVIGNPNVSGDILMALAGHKNPHIRLVVLDRASLPEIILKMLARDPDINVRERAHRLLPSFYM